jgi:hypothetical protein
MEKLQKFATHDVTPEQYNRLVAMYNTLASHSEALSSQLEKLASPTRIPRPDPRVVQPQ